MLLPLLGLQPLLGRGFRDGEDRPGSAPVAMIGSGLWKRRFGGDPALIGKTITMNGVDYTLVGIAPDALAVLTPGDVWVPLTIDPGREIRLNHVITVVGSIKRGVTMQQAQAEMDAVASRVGRQYPEVKDWGIRLMDFYHWFVPDQLRTALPILLGAVALVLLIASAMSPTCCSRAPQRAKKRLPCAPPWAQAGRGCCASS